MTQVLRDKKTGMMTLALFGALLWCGQSAAQSAKEDFRRVLAQMTAPKNLYYEATFLYFEPGSATASDTMLGTYQRAGHREHMRFGQTEMLEEKGVVVVADHREKVVGVRKSGTLGLNMSFDPGQWELLLESNGVLVEYAAAEGNRRTLKVRAAGDKSNSLWLTYSAQDYRLLEVVIEADDPDAGYALGSSAKVRVVGLYTNYQVSALKFPYRQSQFVTKKGKGYAPAGKCAKYRLL